MKRPLISMTFVMMSVVLSAQFSVSSGNAYLMLTDAAYNLDALILINGIDNGTTVNYTGAGSVEWKYTIGTGSYNSTQSSIIPEDGVLYSVEVDGNPEYSVFVIDYSLYKPQYTALRFETDEYTLCEQLYIVPEVFIPELKYKDRDGVERILPREFSLSYTTSAWNNEGEEWADLDTVVDVVTPFDKIAVNTPLRNTDFMLRGDVFAESMGLMQDSIVSDVFIAVNLEGRPKGTIVERDGLNEVDRKSETDVRGSGPLVVDFASRVSPNDHVFYEWYIWGVKNPDNVIRYTDKDFQYTFEDTDEYWVKLVATSEFCEFVDSVSVRVLESMLQVPNVFTPNGDGLNDEFRVAFRSLDSYSIIVKNRWGRTVYKSDNPSKGWDGRIGGAQAAVGTYYYVIFAVGTDVDLDGKPVRYRLSGDINLLR